MHREQLTWLRLAAVLADGAVLALTWVMVVHLRASFGDWQMLLGVTTERTLFLGWLLVPAWLLALYEVGSYTALRRKRPSEVGRELVVATLVALLGVLSLIFLLRIQPASRTLILSFGVIALGPLAVGRWAQMRILGELRAADFDPHRVLIVGDGDVAPFTDALQRHHNWGIEVVDTIGVEDLAARLIAEPIDEVFVTGGLATGPLSQVAAICDELGVPLSLEANFIGLRATHAVLDYYDGWTVLTVHSAPSASLELALKRAMDIGLAATALVIASPLLLAIAIAIRRDGGPSLYIQERMGRYGRPFRMFKFRSMVADAEARLADLLPENELRGPTFKMRDDPRITPLGRWLRRTSIDELPQLWNVLRGDMSLVGPRPPLPAEVACYQRWQLRRLSMKPGITCSWQVDGRSDVDFERWMDLDLEYIDNWTLWLDIRLILKTVPAVIKGTGAR
jgi:exopolysaccharide biosynthesis polyprenyl glycosylphosphotransferase